MTSHSVPERRSAASLTSADLSRFVTYPTSEPGEPIQPVIRGALARFEHRRVSTDADTSHIETTFTLSLPGTSVTITATEYDVIAVQDPGFEQ